MGKKREKKGGERRKRENRKEGERDYIVLTLHSYRIQMTSFVSIILGKTAMYRGRRRCKQEG